MPTPGAIVTFGEPLVRLSAPGAETLLQSPTLGVCFGGAEANVAVSLARLGRDSRYVGVAPDNALGRAARDELRRYGVDVSGVRWGAGRMGLYFLTPGAIRRPADILYDRADSAFALAPADLVDWDAALQGAGWFHISGVTPAIGPRAADAAIRAVEAARRLGLQISFDCNYRPKLWEAWDGDGPAILGRIVANADLLFGDHRDFSLILGRSFSGDADAVRRAGAEAMFEAYPGLQRTACTSRLQHSVDHHDLTGFMFSREQSLTTETVPLWPIVDRIGGGDAFAAGLIHGLSLGWAAQESLEFAVAAAGLKHAIPGDFNLADEAEIRAAMSGAAFDVKR